VSRAYHAVLFDLFGTLVVFDTTALPEIVVDGRRIRSTLGAWSGLVEEALPGVGVEGFARAVMAVSVDLDRARRETTGEFSSRERFRRALALVGCDVAATEELAPLFARAHMRGIAAATRFPAEHQAVLARARARGGVAIITNFDDTATAYDILVRLGIREQVETVVVSEAVGLRKPHGALVRLALRDLGVMPADALMIGDHALEDVGAATAAGVDAAWIDVEGVGVAPTAPAPRYVVRTLPEVAPILG
jgi:HAD superfamily hydrolase (TIGR01549 family)